MRLTIEQFASSAPPTAFAIEWGEVHVWWSWLIIDTPAALVDLEILSGLERNRAERFHFSPDRRRYIASRLLLRKILGRYLGRPPAEVEIGYGPAEKPQLQREAHEPEIYFNVAHTSEMIVYAVANGREVGVDLENIRPIEEMDEISRQYFTPQERNLMNGLASADREKLFFRYWVGKEACLKANGEGIGSGLQCVNVTYCGGNFSEGRAKDSRNSAEWEVRGFEPCNGHVAAVAWVTAGEKSLTDDTLNQKNKQAMQGNRGGLGLGKAQKDVTLH